MVGPGVTQFSIAIAILLSVVIRGLRSGVSWSAVDEGVATAETLRDLTGIMETEKLQDTFGPPRLQDGVYPVTRDEVKRGRTAIGYLLGDKWLDGASAVIALVVLFPVWPLWGARSWLDLLLAFAAFYQLAGWLAAGRFLGRR